MGGSGWEDQDGGIRMGGSGWGDQANIPCRTIILNIHGKSMDIQNDCPAGDICLILARKYCSPPQENMIPHGKKYCFPPPKDIFFPGGNNIFLAVGNHIFLRGEQYFLAIGNHIFLENLMDDQEAPLGKLYGLPVTKTFKNPTILRGGESRKRAKPQRFSVDAQEPKNAKRIP